MSENHVKLLAKARNLSGSCRKLSERALTYPEGVGNLSGRMVFDLEASYTNLKGWVSYLAE